MTLRKSILLLIALGMIAALVACSSSSSTPPPPPAITVTLSSTPTSLYTTAQTPITATTNDSAGVNWAAACKSGASPCGSFSATTSLTGVVVTYTAPANPDTVTITATSITSSSVSASAPAITVTAAPLANGNYTFFLSGLDTDDDSFFFVAGTFTVANAAIAGGEQDYVDDTFYSGSNNGGGADSINATGSSITPTADGNLQIVLSTNDTVVGVKGVETINAALKPSNPTRAVLTEFDASGSASGELRQQDPTAAGATPSAGYAFVVSGWDGGEEQDGVLSILNMGGIINVDGVGTISGSGSIFDANDNSSGTAFQGETLQANTGTVSAPDSFGRVVFSITPTDTTDFPQISWVGYIADSSRINLVETADDYAGTTGGIALSQGANTGTFGTTSVSGGTSGAVTTGFDAIGALQLVTELSFTSTSVSGYIDFNDLVSVEPASPDPVSAASFVVDPTGRVTIPGLTDGSGTSLANNINLQLYLDGNGGLVAVTLDTTDNLGGTLGGQINNSGLTDANFTGTYALTASGWDGKEDGEFSAVGSLTATGTGDTFSGFTDLDFFGAPTTNEALSGTYTPLNTNGVLSPSTITGLDIDSSFANTDNINIYLIGIQGTNTGSDGVFIETDTNQLMIGYFEQ